MDHPSSPGTVAAAVATGTDDGCCGICCDTYTSVVRVRVACPYCAYTACRPCLQRYLLDNLEDAHCMSCRRQFMPDVLESLMTRSFRWGAYKVHKEHALLEHERSMLPATQPFVQLELAKHTTQEQMDELVAQIDAMNLRLVRLVNRRDTINFYLNNDATAQLLPGDIERFIDGDTNTPAPDAAAAASASAPPPRQFVKSCPSSDCRGFLSTAYKCGICGIRVCPKCHEVKKDLDQKAHACDPAVVETLRMIACDSRPCPSCGSMIHRVSGCDQMWCTQCHTTFSWRTGRKLYGQIHNPHYIAYQQQQQQQRPQHTREEQEQEQEHNNGGGCRPQMPSINRVVSVCRPQHPLLQVYRLLVHIQEVVLEHQYPGDVATNGRADETMNRDLRIKYMMKTIDEVHFRRLLHARDKRRAVKHAVHQVMCMVRDVGTDKFQEIVRATKPVPPEMLTGILDELHVLMDYANTALQRIGKSFTYCVPQIVKQGDGDWDVVKMNFNSTKNNAADPAPDPAPAEIE